MSAVTTVIFRSFDRRRVIPGAVRWMSTRAARGPEEYIEIGCSTVHDNKTVGRTEALEPGEADTLLT